MPSNGQSSIRPAVFSYQAGEGAAEHTHDEHQLVYASSGLLSVDTPGQRWIVPPLRAVWVPSGVSHEVSARMDSTMSTLYFRPTVSVGGLDQVAIVKVVPLLRELILYVAAGDLSEAEHRRAEAVIIDQLKPDPSEPLEVPVLVDPRLRTISEALIADPTDSRTLAEFGRDVGASGRTLQRLFRAETGSTFGQWRTQVRLQHSVIELGRGASVGLAAVNSGYEEPSSYIAAFKKAFGITPGTYFTPAGD